MSWAYTYGTDEDGGAVELMANGNQHLYLDGYNDFELTGPSGATLLADHDGNAGLTSGEDGSATLTADAGGQVAADAEGDVAMTGVSGTSIKVEGEDVVISFAGDEESYAMEGPTPPDSTAQEARAKRSEAAIDLLRAAEARADE